MTDTSRSRRRFRGVAAAAASAALTAALLAACSGGGGDAAASSTAAKSTAPTTLPKTVSDTKTPPGKAEDGFVGARADVTEECKPGEKESAATGKVTNPTDEKADYRIYVAFTGEGNRAAGVVQVDVNDVEPKKTKDWEAKMAVGGTDLKCVVRAERIESK